MAEDGNAHITEAAAEKAAPPPTKPKMARKVNLAGLLSLLSFILSLPILAAIIFLMYLRYYDCENILRLSRLQVGVCVGLSFVFLVSNGVAFLLRYRFPVPGLLVVMVPLIMMLTMGLTFVGAYKNMESRSVPGSPTWLKLKVYNEANWDNVKSCIFDTGVCDDLVIRTIALKSYIFNTRKLSPIEAGCCRPPPTCEMEYVNATYWEKPSNGRSNSNPYDQDCALWGNKRDILCYNCNTCKQGFLETLENKWWRIGIFIVSIASLLILVHLSLFLSTIWERLVA